ncbi:uncharacterized protein LOC143658994 [Tamandua tetradactyla]|uniref:uncharacterized protein LOC143658994 n=1 Tax=Tamandua tetradactyla TaxID=48850 RepID=UPI004053F51A
MPRGCLRDRPGSADEPWRAERPLGRRGPAGHRQHGLALEHQACRRTGCRSFIRRAASHGCCVLMPHYSSGQHHRALMAGSGQPLLGETRCCVGKNSLKWSMQ